MLAALRVHPAQRMARGIPWRAWPMAFCTESRRRLEIPRHVVNVTHSRSSGAGGQNVNKVSTKVNLRFALTDAAVFLPEDVMARFREQQRTRITKADELLLSCDEERTQGSNLRRAFARLQEMVDEASVEPKERVVCEEPPEWAKAKRRHDKRKHSQKKAMRRGDDT